MPGRGVREDPPPFVPREANSKSALGAVAYAVPRQQATQAGGDTPGDYVAKEFVLQDLSVATRRAAELPPDEVELSVTELVKRINDDGVDLTALVAQEPEQEEEAPIEHKSCLAAAPDLTDEIALPPVRVPQLDDPASHNRNVLAAAARFVGRGAPRAFDKCLQDLILS